MVDVEKALYFTAGELLSGIPSGIALGVKGLLVDIIANTKGPKTAAIVSTIFAGVDGVLWALLTSWGMEQKDPLSMGAGIGAGLGEAISAIQEVIWAINLSNMSKPGVATELPYRVKE